MSSYFVSDLHLIDDADEKSKKFIQVLKKYGTQCQHWVLLGDIFDSWIADHDYFNQKHAQVVAELVQLQKSGVEIHFFEGNHDLHLKEFWQQRHGIRVHPDIARFKWYGKKIRCEHGDLMNPNDKNYLLLRKFLRTRFIRNAAFNLSGKTVGALAEGWSQHSRKKTSKSSSDRDQRIRQMMHAYAVKEAATEDFDYLITGHTHTRDEFQIPGAGGKQFINLGTWLNQPSVFELSEKGHRFIDVL